MNKLANKVAVVTGGNSGIGLATAKLFVEEGAYVYIFGRNQDKINRALAEIGHNVTAVRGDVSNAADMDRLYTLVKQQHGRLNVVFANAGIGDVSPLGAITEEALEHVFDVEVKGTVFTIQKALPLLQEESSIILNSSVLALRPFPTASVYAAAKAAIRSFARSWALELLERKIRVNAISAGTIDTDVLHLTENDEENERIRQILIARTPMKRIGVPHEIATSLVYLASDDSSFVTGIDLNVDGGASQL